jgi:uncharacterized membrane protein
MGLPFDNFLNEERDCSLNKTKNIVKIFDLMFEFLVIYVYASLGYWSVQFYVILRISKQVIVWKNSKRKESEIISAEFVYFH